MNRSHTMVQTALLLTYSLASQRDTGFEVEVRGTDGRRWLAEVTPLEDGDQHVVVCRLTAAPSCLIDPGDYLVGFVGSWFADAADEPDVVAAGVMRCCRMTSTRVA